MTRATTDSLGTIVGIDRSLRVPVKRAEIWMPAELASDVLGRAPDVAEGALVSWGNLSREQVSALITLERKPAEEEEALDELRSLFDAAEGNALQWSLFYRRDEHGE